METEMVIQLVGTIGFPSAMCLFFSYYILKKDDKQTNVLMDNTKALTELNANINRLLYEQKEK